MASSALPPVNFLSVLLSDLRSLSVESRKKHSAIKEISERAILRVRQAEGREREREREREEEVEEEVDVAKNLRSSEDILRPFLLTLTTSNRTTKMVLIALSSLQKLIAHRAVERSKLPSVVESVVIQVDLHEDDIHLKVLQLVLTIISAIGEDYAGQPHLQVDDVVSKSLPLLLGVCIKLHYSGQTSLSHSASSSGASSSGNNAPSSSPSLHPSGAGNNSGSSAASSIIAAGGHVASSTVRNTAAATLRQVVTILMERADAEAQIRREREREREGKDEEHGEGDGGSEEKDNVPKHLRQFDTHKHTQIGICCAFLIDLCQWAQGDSAVWIPHPGGEVSKDLCLELIDSVLENWTECIKTTPELLQIIQDRCCLMLVRGIRSSYTYSTVVRLFKCVSTLLRSYGSDVMIQASEIFLNFMIKTVQNHQRQLWYRLLAVEVLQAVVETEGLVRSIVVNYDLRTDATAVFAQLTNSLSAFVQSSVLDITQRDTLKMLEIRSGVPEYYVLTHLASSPRSQLSLPLAISSAVHCILMLVSIISAHCGSTQPSKPSKSASSDSNAESKASQEAAEEARNKSAYLCRREAELSWTSILACLGIILERVEGEDRIQILLRAYQQFTQTCGLMGLATARDAFITSLCKYTLPPSHGGAIISGGTSIQPSSSTSLIARWTDDEDGASLSNTDGRLTVKNVLVLKALFNISHGLGGVLGSSWYLILKNFEQLNRILIRARRSISEAESSDLSRSMGIDDRPKSAGDLAILSDLLSHLFESTKYLSPHALNHVINALSKLAGENLGALCGGLPQGGLTQGGLAQGGLTQGGLASGGLTQTGLASGGFGGSKSGGVGGSSGSIAGGGSGGGESGIWSADDALFGTMKLVETAQHNIHRINLLWTLVVQHMTAIMDHPLPAVRTYCVSGVLEIIARALAERDTTEANPPTSPGLGSPIAEKESVEWSSVPIDPASLEVSLLSPLQVMCGSLHADIRTKALEAVFTLLHTCGHSIHSPDAWTLLLAILRQPAAAESLPESHTESRAESRSESGAESYGKGSMSESRAESRAESRGESRGESGGESAVGDSAQVACAFKSVQYICTDFFQHMSVEGLRDLIDVLGQFLTQKAAGNISLSACGLLWNVSDHLRSVTDEIIARKAKEEELEKIGDVWVELYEQMQRGCIDRRPEVRHGALRTLNTTLCTHGKLLSLKNWKHCLNNVVLDLVEKAEKYGKSASTSENDLQLINGSGESKGESSVPLMVHHSRNTAAKQWVETRTLTLDLLVATVQLFWSEFGEAGKRKAELIQQGEDGSFPSLLSRIHNLLLSAAMDQSTEVSSAAIRASQTIALQISSKLAWELWISILESVIHAHDAENIASSSASDHPTPSEGDVVGTEPGNKTIIPCILGGGEREELCVRVLDGVGRVWKRLYVVREERERDSAGEVEDEGLAPRARDAYGEPTDLSQNELPPQLLSRLQEEQEINARRKQAIIPDQAMQYLMGVLRTSSTYRGTYIRDRQGLPIVQAAVLRLVEMLEAREIAGRKEVMEMLMVYMGGEAPSHTNLPLLLRQVPLLSSILSLLLSTHSLFPSLLFHSLIHTLARASISLRVALARTAELHAVPQGEDDSVRSLYDLWKKTAESYVSVLEKGVSDLLIDLDQSSKAIESLPKSSSWFGLSTDNSSEDLAAHNQKVAQYEEMWRDVIDTMEKVLLRTPIFASALDDTLEQRLVSHSLLPLINSSLTLSLKTRLLKLLLEGSTQITRADPSEVPMHLPCNNSGGEGITARSGSGVCSGGSAGNISDVRETFSRTCLDALFEICRNGTNAETREMVTPHLLTRARHILSLYLRDLRHAGSLPLPRVRQSELRSITSHLLKWRLDARQRNALLRHEEAGNNSPDPGSRSGSMENIAAKDVEDTGAGVSGNNNQVPEEESAAKSSGNIASNEPTEENVSRNSSAVGINCSPSTVGVGSGECVHLFLLWDLFTELSKSNDLGIREIVYEYMKTVGMDMGLIARVSK